MVKFWTSYFLVVREFFTPANSVEIYCLNSLCFTRDCFVDKAVRFTFWQVPTKVHFTVGKHPQF